MEKECRLLRSSGSGANSPKGNLAPISLPGGGVEGALLTWWPILGSET